MKFFIFFLFLLFMSCDSESDKQSRIKNHLINCVFNDVAQEIKAETGLRPFGTGARAMYKIKMLTLSFNGLKTIEVNAARQLLIESTDRLIKRVNSDEKIRPFLSDYPFEPKNVEIRIFFSHSSLSELVVAEVAGGKIKYLADSLDHKSYVLLLEETYEQAVEKLKEKAA